MNIEIVVIVVTININDIKNFNSEFFKYAFGLHLTKQNNAIEN